MTIEPTGSVTGKPAPSPAASDSSISSTSDTPAANAASRIARRSTAVASDGTHNVTSTRRPKRERVRDMSMKLRIICSAACASAITPCRMGRTASRCPGSRPTSAFASSPTASSVGRASLAPPLRKQTTDGWFSTTPRSCV